MIDVIGRIERGEVAVCEDISSTMYSEWRMANQETNDALLSLVKLGQAMQWVAVSDRLPEVGQVVDVIYRHGSDSRQYRATGVVYDQFEQFGMYNNVTHWMLLLHYQERVLSNGRYLCVNGDKCYYYCDGCGEYYRIGKEHKCVEGKNMDKKKR